MKALSRSPYGVVAGVATATLGGRSGFFLLRARIRLGGVLASAAGEFSRGMGARLAVSSQTPLYAAFVLASAVLAREPLGDNGL